MHRLSPLPFALFFAAALIFAAAGRVSADPGVPLQPEATGYHPFTSVTAVSPRAAFTAGDFGLSTHPRMKNWDGKTWTNSRRMAGPHSWMTGIDALSSRDAWAVGYGTDHDHGTGTHSLTIHWNGSRWRVVDSGGTGQDQETVVWAVSMASSDDVWAVGWDTGGEEGPLTAVIKHWDGGTWKQVCSPVEGYLYAVTAIAADDVWIAGQIGSGSEFLHWDGSTWATMPAAGSIAHLDAISPNDVWAVGSRYRGNEVDTLAEHWDGTSWTIVSTPNPGGATGTEFVSVSASSPEDVWAAGYTIRESYYPGTTIIEHWDGTTWSVIPSPSPGHTWNGLTGISADSATDAWAAGTYSNDPDPDKGKTLLLHWDGATWTVDHHVR
jgi:hypothetical protein